MSLAVRTALQARQRGEVGRVMMVLITDGRANIGLARSNEEPDAMGPDAVKPTTVRRRGVRAVPVDPLGARINWGDEQQQGGSSPE